MAAEFTYGPDSYIVQVPSYVTEFSDGYTPATFYEVADRLEAQRLAQLYSRPTSYSWPAVGQAPETRTATAFVEGKARTITLVRIQDIWMEADSARALNAMLQAAARDGLNLQLNSGFRSMAEQRAQWERRLGPDGKPDPEKVAQLGAAAYPGYSKHQSGVAVDINTGLTASSFASGARSPVYNWLELNAPKFGFKRTVAREPWHWVYQGGFSPALKGGAGLVLGLAAIGGLAWLLMRKR